MNGIYETQWCQYRRPARLTTHYNSAVLHALENRASFIEKYSSDFISIIFKILFQYICVNQDLNDIIKFFVLYILPIQRFSENDVLLIDLISSHQWRTGAVSRLFNILYDLELTLQ